MLIFGLSTCALASHAKLAYTFMAVVYVTIATLYSPKPALVAGQKPTLPYRPRVFTALIPLRKAPPRKPLSFGFALDPFKRLSAQDDTTRTWILTKNDQSALSNLLSSVGYLAQHGSTYQDAPSPAYPSVSPSVAKGSSSTPSNRTSPTLIADDFDPLPFLHPQSLCVSLLDSPIDDLTGMPPSGATSSEAGGASPSPPPPPSSYPSPPFADFPNEDDAPADDDSPLPPPSPPDSDPPPSGPGASKDEPIGNPSQGDSSAAPDSPPPPPPPPDIEAFLMPVPRHGEWAWRFLALLLCSMTLPAILKYVWKNCLRRYLGRPLSRLFEKHLSHRVAIPMRYVPFVPFAVLAGPIAELMLPWVLKDCLAPANAESLARFLRPYIDSIAVDILPYLVPPPSHAMCLVMALSCTLTIRFIFDFPSYVIGTFKFIVRMPVRLFRFGKKLPRFMFYWAIRPCFVAMVGSAILYTMPRRVLEVVVLMRNSPFLNCRSLDGVYIAVLRALNHVVNATTLLDNVSTAIFSMMLTSIYFPFYCLSELLPRMLESVQESLPVIYRYLQHDVDQHLQIAANVVWEAIVLHYYYTATYLGRLESTKQLMIYAPPIAYGVYRVFGCFRAFGRNAEPFPIPPLIFLTPHTTSSNGTPSPTTSTRMPPRPRFSRALSSDTLYHILIHNQTWEVNGRRQEAFTLLPVLRPPPGRRNPVFSVPIPIPRPQFDSNGNAMNVFPAYVVDYHHKAQMVASESRAHEVIDEWRREAPRGRWDFGPALCVPVTEGIRVAGEPRLDGRWRVVLWRATLYRVIVPSGR